MSQVRNIANRTLLCRVEERVNGSLYPNEIERNLVKVPGCSVSACFEDKESDSQFKSYEQAASDRSSWAFIIQVDVGYLFLRVNFSIGQFT